MVFIDYMDINIYTNKVLKKALLKNNYLIII